MRYAIMPGPVAKCTENLKRNKATEGSQKCILKSEVTAILSYSHSAGSHLPQCSSFGEKFKQRIVAKHDQHKYTRQSEL